MVEMAEILRRYGPQYRAKYGAKMLPSHQKAMRAIVRCRTPALGGHIYVCEECHETQYQYHSCRNRRCPKCQNGKAQQWLERQRNLLLPLSYFLLTFTLPDDLRRLARSHQKLFYDLLFRASAAATQQLARAPRKALSRIFPAKFRDALRKTDCLAAVPRHVWAKAWVVHCQPAGKGLTALRYLAPYIFRVAISNNRILTLADGKVTLRYRTSDTGKLKTCTLPTEGFIRRFLQHVLPTSFVKVRYYGFLSPGCRQRLAALRQLVGNLAAQSLPTSGPNVSDTQSADPLLAVCGSSPNLLLQTPSGSTIPIRGLVQHWIHVAASRHMNPYSLCFTNYGQTL